MVTFSELWRRYPINESVEFPCIAPRDLINLEGEQISAGLPVYANQGAIRLGVTLKRVGVRPITGVVTCGVHPPEEMHYLRAAELAKALERSVIEGIGPIEKLTGSQPAHFYPMVFGRPGIIYFQDFWQRVDDKPGEMTGDHIDLWNGYRTSAKWLMEWFSWLGYTSNYNSAREIWFWPLR
jgi:hypothetical protein